MCDFIRHPYSNGYSIACACWSRYAFARRERQVLVVGVGEGQLTRVRDRVAPRIYAYLRAARTRARSMRELNTCLSVA